MEESLAASFMARARVRELVTSMNAGGSGDAGSGTPVTDWIMRPITILHIINNLVTLQDERMNDAKRGQLRQLASQIHAMDSSGNRNVEALKRAMNVCLKQIRAIVHPGSDSDDALLKWAIVQTHKQAQAQASASASAGAASSSSASSSTADASSSRKRPLDEAAAPAPAPAPADAAAAAAALRTFVAGAQPAREDWDAVFERELAHVAAQFKTPPWIIEGATGAIRNETFASFVPKDDYATYVGSKQPAGHFHAYTHPFDETEASGQLSMIQDWMEQTEKGQRFKQGANLPNSSLAHMQWMKDMCDHVANQPGWSDARRTETAKALMAHWTYKLKEEGRFWGENWALTRKQDPPLKTILIVFEQRKLDPFAGLLGARYTRAHPNAAHQHVQRVTDYWELHMKRWVIENSPAWEREQTRLLDLYKTIMNDGAKSPVERQRAADRYEATQALHTKHHRAPHRPSYPGGPSWDPQAPAPAPAPTPAPAPPPRPAPKPWDGLVAPSDIEYVKAAVERDPALEQRIYDVCWKVWNYRGRDDAFLRLDGTEWGPAPPLPVARAAALLKVVQEAEAGLLATASLSAGPSDAPAAAPAAAPAPAPAPEPMVVDLTESDDEGGANQG